LSGLSVPFMLTVVGMIELYFRQFSPFSMLSMARTPVSCPLPQGNFRPVPQSSLSSSPSGSSSRNHMIGSKPTGALHAIAP